jgi:hypothetical protein
LCKLIIALQVYILITFIVNTYKYSDYHPEHHYVIQTSWDYVLQETILLSEFYDDRLTSTGLYTKNIFQKNPLLHSQWSNIMPNYFKYITASSFKLFFQQHKIDIPTLFKPSKSLYRPNNEILLLKFNNYIFRDGQLFKTSKLFNIVLWNLFSRVAPTYNKLKISVSRLSKIKFNLSMCLHYCEGYFKAEPLTDNTHLEEGEAHINPSAQLNKSLKKLKPIFAFYIYKVDKNIYKNTRGKSGKFTFIWKYIAPYKRTPLTLSWLAKELRTRPGHTFSSRLYNLLTSLLFEAKTL